MSKNIKQDINFLEYPSHVVDYQSNKQIFKMETDKGSFTLASSANNRLPSGRDRVILYHFLKELSKDGFKEKKIITSRYAVSKDIWGTASNHYYKKIIEALTRYTGLTATFDNIFYEGKQYKKRIFHFIESVDFMENGKLIIIFNETFINQLKTTHYYRLINYDEIKTLRSNLSVRLYEYLLKLNLPFKIGIIKLGKKLTLAENQLYPSVILQKFERSLKEINKKTTLKIDFNYNKERKIITFFPAKPDSQIIQKTEENNFNLSDDTTTKEILNTLSKEEYTILESKTIAILKEQNYYLPDSERGRNIIKEEMVKILVEEKESQIAPAV